MGLPSISHCYGITKDPKKDDYLLVFEYAKNGDYIIIYQKILKELLGNKNSIQFIIFHWGKVFLDFYY